MHSHKNRSLASMMMACVSLIALVPFIFESAAAPLPPMSKPPIHPLSSNLIVPGGFPAHPQASPPPMMQMPMVFPLFLQNQDFTSTLVLTNALAQSTYADVILKSTTGLEISRQRVEFSAHSQRTVDVQSLLMTAVSPATTGSITVMQESPELDGTMAILGQLSLTYRVADKPNYIDEEIAMPTAQGSQALRAVADPGEGSPLVAITNLSEAGQHVAIQCLEEKGSNFSKSVDLLAGETLLTEACSNRTTHGAGIESFSAPSTEGSDGAVGVSLVTDGMPGSFAAFGLRLHKENNNKSFSAMTFTDPKTLSSSTTIFAGVPVGPASLLQEGKYTPQLSLSNFSSKTLQVHVQYAHLSGAAPATQDIAGLTVPAGTSKSIKFGDIVGDPQLQNSFLVTSNASPGDLIAKLVSRNDSAQNTVELLGKDAQDSNDGGSNPWSIEQGTESTLLFFNHDKVPQIFNVFIASADGSQWDKDFKVAPMETLAISIGGIVQNQMKDDKGKTLPKTAVSGQISWWTVETASGPGTGRLLQSNPESGVARSFACGCPYRLCGVGFNQDYLLIVEGFLGVPLDGLSTRICMYQVGSNCGTKQTMNSSSQAISYSWSSSNSAILQINGSSTNSSVNVYGAGFGTATMTGTASATYFGPPATCSFPGGGPTPVNVSAALTLTNPTFTTQVAGGTATFNAVVTIGAVSNPSDLPVTFTVTMSAPSNPNGVVLAEGGSSGQHPCQITTSAGNCTVQFPVKSDANNNHSGAVTWQFTAATTNTDYGSPAGTATPSPNPLVGTVNFVQ